MNLWPSHGSILTLEVMIRLKKNPFSSDTVCTWCVKNQANDGIKVRCSLYNVIFFTFEILQHIWISLWIQSVTSVAAQSRVCYFLTWNGVVDAEQVAVSVVCFTSCVLPELRLLRFTTFSGNTCSCTLSKFWKYRANCNGTTVSD